MNTLLALALNTGLPVLAVRAQNVSFDDAKPGAVPFGWIGIKTGEG